MNWNKFEPSLQKIVLFVSVAFLLYLAYIFFANIFTPQGDRGVGATAANELCGKYGQSNCEGKEIVVGQEKFVCTFGFPSKYANNPICHAKRLNE